ncbi:DUF4054 domain-containing protein [Lactobacillus amylolyticus]|uniref:DUF4054 domain-containing protein n=1 Tax=Lactobacillus amylolyticus TaxID=83683 RepID=UPI002492A03B|nr:DUF4054 domain-containing protein [Lactobacillus amylolyticus]
MDNQVTTTVDVVKAIDPKLTSELSDDTIQALISNAGLIALGDRIPKIVEIDGEQVPIRDMATRYMTLHLIATSTGKAGQGITEEKVDVLEKHYADTTSLDWLNKSPWGQAYLRLFQEYGDYGVTKYGVVQH